jgi:hypothetical protein
VEHGELFYTEVNITCFGDLLIFLKRVLTNKTAVTSGFPVEKLIVTQLVTNSSVLYETPKLIFLKAL